jgi:hypothetical protein
MEVVKQMPLPMPIRAAQEVPWQIIETCPSLVSSVRLMITTAGYELDQVGCALGYSSSHWSEILNGKKNLPWERLKDAMDFCGSDLPLYWLCHDRGYEQPHKKQSALEKELDDLKLKHAAVCEVLATMVQTKR